MLFYPGTESSEGKQERKTSHLLRTVKDKANINKKFNSIWNVGTDNSTSAPTTPSWNENTCRLFHYSVTPHEGGSQIRGVNGETWYEYPLARRRKNVQGGYRVIASSSAITSRQPPPPTPHGGRQTVVAGTQTSREDGSPPPVQVHSTEYKTRLQPPLSSTSEG